MTLAQLLIAIDDQNKIAEMIQEPKLSVFIYIDGMELKNVITGGDTFTNRYDFDRSIRHEYIGPLAREINIVTYTKDLERLHPDSTPRGWVIDCKDEGLRIHRIGLLIVKGK